MPLYDYRCAVCGEESELYRSLSDQATAPQHCGMDMVQIHKAAPYGAVQMEARYVCPATGQKITTWKQRHETFRRHNLADVSDMSSSKWYERESKKWAEIKRLASAPMNELPPGHKADDFLPAA